MLETHLMRLTTSVNASKSQSGQPGAATFSLESGREPCTAVLFDGSCPMCRREIAMYRKLEASAALQWVDISVPDYRPPAGLTRNALMARFHAVKPDGEVLSGARAFVHLWAQLPGWRYLARVANIPGAPAVMEAMYRGFLVIRPRMQSSYRRWRQ